MVTLSQPVASRGRRLPQKRTLQMSLQGRNSVNGFHVFAGSAGETPAVSRMTLLTVLRGVTPVLGGRSPLGVRAVKDSTARLTSPSPRGTASREVPVPGGL